MIYFNYFDSSDILDKFCRPFGIDIDETKKYLLKVDFVHTSYSKMAADLKLNLLKSTNDCSIYCKHFTTCNDDLESIMRYGLLRLDEVLIADTPLKRFLAEYNIQIEPVKKEFSYKRHIWKINAPNEQCQPCIRNKPCGAYALCDFREQMGMLHSKLYHDKGEIEFFIGGDEKTINGYQTIQEAPEILINVARIMKCMHSKISEYCLQNFWNRKDNWKKYLLEFYIPYEALEMNIEIKRDSYYYDCREWLELVGFSEDDYFDDVVPLTFYHNKHIIENCLSLFFEGESLIKFGQLLPDYHISFNMFSKITDKSDY